MKYVYYLAGSILVEVMSTAIAKALILQGSHLAYFISPIFLILSYYFLGKAVQGIALSIAYAIWGGLGLFGAVAIGHFAFHEAITLTKVLAFILIGLGLVLMHNGTQMPGGEQNE